MVIAVAVRADLNAEDQTGYVWAFLDEARDPSLITPGALWWLATRMRPQSRS